MFDYKSFIIGGIVGAGTMMAVELISDAIIKKKREKEALKEAQRTREEVEEWVNGLREEAKEFDEDDDPELKEQMMAEKREIAKKYETEAMKYHNNYGQLINENSAEIEEIDEGDEDEDPQEIDKYAGIGKAHYFIDEEDASNDGLNDLIDCIFCSDGIIVRCKDEEILSLSHIFGSDISKDDIYNKFTLENFEPIFVRSERDSIDYALEWSDKSYKEAFA